MGPVVKKLPLAIAVSAMASSAVLADHIEEVKVLGERVYPVQVIEAPQHTGAVDAAELLKQLPGANVNANGKLTGIAQYRGMYGDRVAVSVDGMGLVTGGPNAMDAPLSYASPLLLKNLSLERGIPSVSSAAESMGGHFQAEYDRGDFGADASFALSGSLQTRFESNGDQNSSALRLIGANDAHKVALLAAIDRGDDRSYPGGEVSPSELERDRFDISYGYTQDDLSVLAYAGRLDTTDTGTPSLPMDINWIETDLYGATIKNRIGNTKVELAVGYSDVDHLMDNFTYRTAPASPMQYRQTRALGDGYKWRLGTETPIGDGSLRLGIDGSNADHNATITNPNNAMFRVENFRDVERDALGIYAQWNQSVNGVDIEAGVRLNRIDYDAGTVSIQTPPMMAMMQMNANMLAMRFNSSERDQSHDNVDVVLKVGKLLSANHSVYVELAQKTRAPSYQQMYLWLPMQATGGLADGRTYIGDVNLDSEKSLEINIGTDWYGEHAWLTPQVFYKDVSDYIQGVTTMDMTANMLANMMGGQNVLQFANIDAKIYGFDIAFGYKFGPSWALEGVINYSRGERDDIDDNLYRLAPLNGRLGLVYTRDAWKVRSDVIAYDRQDKVSAINNERESGGYAIWNISAEWQLNAAIMFSAAVENLLDKSYQEHLGGVNRVREVDIAVGDRVYGSERNFKVGVTFTW
jgi:iron complex outermembrane receptor protein